MRKYLFISLASLSAAVVAQSSAPVQFINQPGNMEFSGRMMARPVQVLDLLEKGVPYQTATRRHDAGAAHLKRYAIQYYGATDEFVIDIPWGMNENTFSAQLMATGNYQYVEPNWTVYPLVIPTDVSYPSQWALPKINAPAAWNHYTGSSTIIAITDTGVRTNHQDLASQLVSGANSATGTAIPQTSGGLVEDVNGHGSHCAGIAAARANNTVATGTNNVTGINWNARIMPVRVSNSSGGSSSIAALNAGIRWAADNGARVISTSYSGVSTASVQTTGNYCKVTRNALSCWAAGNSNVNVPTDHVDVTIVGSSSPSDGKSSFSNFGPGIDVFAPGEGIFSTYFGSATAYANLSGTSMACPLAAGLANLLTGANPTMTAQQIEDILYQTCFDLTALPGGVGNDSYWGWGRIDALAAVQRVYNTYPFRQNSINLVVGSPVSGGLPELHISDNSYYRVGAPTSGARLLDDIHFNATTTNNQVSRLDVVIESSSSAGATLGQTVQLFNFQTGGWESLNKTVISSTDQTLTLSVPSPAPYIDAGLNIRTRVIYYQVTPTLPTGWTANIDRLTVLTAP
ncbi:MAG: S8 family serine peptidase [Fimbriimonadaceae bacterium]